MNSPIKSFLADISKQSEKLELGTEASAKYQLCIAQDDFDIRYNKSMLCLLMGCDMVLYILSGWEINGRFW